MSLDVPTSKPDDTTMGLGDSVAVGSAADEVAVSVADAALAADAVADAAPAAVACSVEASDESVDAIRGSFEIDEMHSHSPCKPRRTLSRKSWPRVAHRETRLSFLSRSQQRSKAKTPTAPTGSASPAAATRVPAEHNINPLLVTNRELPSSSAQSASVVIEHDSDLELGQDAYDDDYDDQTRANVQAAAKALEQAFMQAVPQIVATADTQAVPQAA
ncbi:hypothetical protein HK105_204101 [Polyrhizophydium stewartii]|uniref:Uncharacterized protein n=1 Tax=Polyrhizophydium stewartii TaxID=2732419 RepID=A0ABR4N9X5_9FUNG